MMFKKSISILLLSFIIVSAAYTSDDNTLTKKVLILYEERYFYGDSRDTVTAITDLLGHFQTEIETAKISEQKKFDFSKYDSIFVLALDHTIDNNDFYQTLSSYSGDIIWLGKSIEPLINAGDYSLAYGGEVYDLLSVRYRKSLTGDEKVFSIGTKRAFYKVESTSNDNKVFAWLSDGSKDFPFIIQSRNLVYISRVDINEPLFYIFSDFLSQLLYEKKYQGDYFLISIEDVNVFSDYEKLHQLADILNKNQLPFTVGLIPYIQQSGAEYITSFTEVTEFIDTLRYMQDKGGVIILHTYIHEMTPDNFTLSKLETGDLNGYFSKAVDDCIENGLVPIGYEAPHVYLSSSEYSALKSIFSTAFGQVTITDGNYVIYPFELKDTENFNNLYPLNLGYVDLSNNNKFNIIEERLKRIQLVNGYFAGIYFHSSLDESYLTQLIELMSDEGISSYNPLKDKHTVSTKNYNIIIDNGKVEITSFKQDIPLSPIQVIVNFLASIVMYILVIALLLFVSILAFSIRRQRKSMFK